MILKSGFGKYDDTTSWMNSGPDLNFSFRQVYTSGDVLSCLHLNNWWCPDCAFRFGLSQSNPSLSCLVVDHIIASLVPFFLCLRGYQ